MPYLNSDTDEFLTWTFKENSTNVLGVCPMKALSNIDGLFLFLSTLIKSEVHLFIDYLQRCGTIQWFTWEFFPY